MRSENDYSSIAPNGPRISISRLVKVSTEVTSNDEKKRSGNEDKSGGDKKDWYSFEFNQFNIVYFVWGELGAISYSIFFQCSKCKLG